MALHMHEPSTSVAGAVASIRAVIVLQAMSIAIACEHRMVSTKERVHNGKVKQRGFQQPTLYPGSNEGQAVPTGSSLLGLSYGAACVTFSSKVLPGA